VGRAGYGGTFRGNTFRRNDRAVYKAHDYQVNKLMLFTLKVYQYGKIAGMKKVPKILLLYYFFRGILLLV
jgi:hypothetical protein